MATPQTTRLLVATMFLGAFVLVGVPTAHGSTWVEPGSQPPAGNPPGFVWTLPPAGPAQPGGQFNLSGSGSLGGFLQAAGGVVAGALGFDLGQSAGGQNVIYGVAQQLMHAQDALLLLQVQPASGSAIDRFRVDGAGNVTAVGVLRVGGGFTAPTVKVDGDVQGKRFCLGSDCKASWAEVVTSGSSKGNVALQGVTPGTVQQGHLNVSGIAQVGALVSDGVIRAKGGIRGAGSGILRQVTDSGYVDIGAQNPGFVHFVTDRPRYWFNQTVWVDSGQVSSYDENLELQTRGITRATISDQTGNLGVGAAPDPSDRLLVSGNTRVTGTLNAGGLCINGECRTAWPPVGGTSGTSVLLQSGTLNAQTGGLAVTGDARSARVIATTELQTPRLCLGGACVASWAEAVSNGGGSSSNALTIQSTTGALQYQGPGRVSLNGSGQFGTLTLFGGTLAQRAQRADPVLDIGRGSLVLNDGDIRALSAKAEVDRLNVATTGHVGTLAVGTYRSVDQMQQTGRLYVDGQTNDAGPWAVIRGGDRVGQNIALQLADAGTADGNVNVLDFAHGSTGAAGSDPGAISGGGGLASVARVKSVNVGGDAQQGARLILETASNNRGAWNTNQLVLDRDGAVRVGSGGLCLGGQCVTSWAQTASMSSSGTPVLLQGQAPGTAQRGNVNLEGRLALGGGLIVQQGGSPSLLLRSFGPAIGSELTASAQGGDFFVNSAADLQLRFGSGVGDEFRINNGSNQAALTIQNNRNVGVGTSASAQHRLDVAGNVNATALCLSGSCQSSWSQAAVAGLGGSPVLLQSSATPPAQNGNANLSGVLQAQDVTARGAVRGQQLCFGSDCRASWAQATAGSVSPVALQTTRPGSAQTGHLNINGDARVGDLYVTNGVSASSFLMTTPQATASWSLNGSRIDVGTYSNSDLALITGRTNPRIYLQHRTGRVGIGTQDPQAQLHVGGVGDIRADGTMTAGATVSGRVLSASESVIVTGSSLLVGGEPAHVGYRISNRSCQNTVLCEAKCDTGWLPVGGGCESLSRNAPIFQTFPSGDRWRCQTTIESSFITAHAICARMAR